MLASTVVLPDGIQHLNWVDYTFVVVIAYSMLAGAWIGFLSECLTVAGVAVGTAAAGLSYNQVGGWLSHLGVPSDARGWAGFVVVFVLISLLLRAASIKARRLSRMMVPSLSNELAGALIGLVAGAMICLFALVTAVYFGVGKVDGPMHNSQLAAHSGGLVKEYVTLLPQKMHDIWPAATPPPSATPWG